MRRIPQEDFKPLLIEILKALQIYCQDHGLEFILAGGTLIGAVRHHGFIPWDDDIDLWMRCDSFYKLTELAKADPYIDEKKRYKILPACEFPNTYPFIKVIDTTTVVYEKNIHRKYAIGLWIDVFLLSYWPDDDQEARRRYELQQHYKNRNKIMIGGNYRVMKYRLIEPFAKPVRTFMYLRGQTSEYWCRKMLKLSDHEPSGYVGNISWPLNFKDRLPAEWFEEVTELPFEGQLYKVPKEYDKILTYIYGDYMTPPPEDKRISHAIEGYYR